MSLVDRVADALHAAYRERWYDLPRGQAFTGHSVDSHLDTASLAIGAVLASEAREDLLAAMGAVQVDTQPQGSWSRDDDPPVYVFSKEA